MRIKNVLKNSSYAVISYIIIGFLGLLLRKFFVQYLPVELLGLEGLFSNIIAVLSLAEMGISTVISYGLYRELATKNEAEINILMGIYKYIYTFIGIIVFFVGTIIYFFLPSIIKDTNVSEFYIKTVYIIQVLSVLMSYFLAYKRTLFTADQKDYICVKVDTMCSVMGNVLKFIAIIGYQSYFMYAITSLVSNIIANIIISRKIEENYPFLKTIQITIKDMRDRKIFYDVKNFLIHKISYIVYGGLDMIIVSVFIGLKEAGLLSNYILIYGAVYNLLYKALQGIIPSIGNLIHNENSSRTYKLYSMLDLIYFFIAAYILCIFIILFQPFIKLFFGENYLLPNSYIICLSINIFLSIAFENACNFRSTIGFFEKDKYYMIASSIVNIIVSLILITYVGVAGVVIGKICGLLFIIYGRVKCVFSIILINNKKKYLEKRLLWCIAISLEVVIIYFIASKILIENTYCFLLMKGFGIVLGMSILQCLFFYQTKEFKDVLQYLKEIKVILLKKINNNI